MSGAVMSSLRICRLGPCPVRESLQALILRVLTPMLNKKKQNSCVVLKCNIEYSQLLNIIILKSNSPVLLNLLGNIFPYCPNVGAIQIINPFNIENVCIVTRVRKYNAI